MLNIFNFIIIISFQVSVLRLDFDPAGLGVPGHAGTGAVGQAVGPRRDLGTIPGASSFDLDLNVTSEEFSLPRSESFVGTLTNMFFGRKGGLL